MSEQPPSIQEEHEEYRRRIIYVVILLLILLFGGATFYHKVEKWRYLDALYFSTATMTTVGYGDITPKTDFGRMFTIVYAFTGVAMALYGLSLMASHFVEVKEKTWLKRITKIRQIHNRPLIQKIKGLFTKRKK